MNLMKMIACHACNAHKLVDGLLYALCTLAAIAIGAPPALADSPNVRITPESELDFGTFMVFGSGARKVGSTGVVTDFSIAPLEGRLPSPARFTITYDRGNEGRNVLDIELEVVMHPSPQVRVGGIQASLSSFETNLPNALTFVPGQAIRISIPDCRTRVCSRSFQIGARLDVTRAFGGAQVLIPIPLNATIISAERQSR